MRGRYNDNKRRILTGNGYKITIGAVIAIAVALCLLLLIFLPAVDAEPTATRSIVSIENIRDEIGVDDDLSAVFVKVNYSDGTYAEVAVSEMLYEGLDVTKPTTQNVVLNYGGFEQTLKIKVSDTTCKVVYTASIGGTIRGDTVQRIVAGGDGTKVIAVPETGYVFLEWDDGHPLAERKDLNVNSHVEYTAKFVKARFTVRFHYSDDTIAVEELVPYGAAPSQAPSPTADPKMQKYGYVFTNWVPLLDDIVVDRDLDIYPEYTKQALDVSVEVPLDYNGDRMGIVAGAQGLDYYSYNETAVIVATPSQSRVFAYWEIQTSTGVWTRLERESSGANVSFAGMEFSSTRTGNNAYQLSFIANSNVPKLYLRAVFAYDESTLTFINTQNSKENNIEWSILLKYGSPLKSYESEGLSFAQGMPAPPEVTGMEFVGWYREGTDVEVTIESIFEQPTSIIARWSRLQYQVNFIYYNEAGEQQTWHTTYVYYTDTLASGTSGGIPSNAPARTHYTFVGWQDQVTGALVDDKTKIYSTKEYESDSNFQNRIINIVPVWTPIEHTLNVKITGSGKVTLVENEGKQDTNGTSLTVYYDDIRGSVDITEDNSYTLYFEALEGYSLTTLIWTYDNTTVTTGFETNEYNHIYIPLQVATDNDIVVVFSVKKFTVSVKNGDDFYSGAVRYNGVLYAGDADLLVEYNASIDLTAVSLNAEYAIQDIKVDGVSLTDGQGSSLIPTGATEYTFTLNRCRKDTAIEIIYSVRRFSVELDSSVLQYTQLVDFYTGAMSQPGASQEYVYGTTNVYRITAPAAAGERYYIKGISVNGLFYDLYANMNPDVRFYHWYLNGVFADITVKDLNGTMCYYYGETDYNGETYGYAERISDSAPCVYYVTTEVNGTVHYTEVTENVNSYVSYLYQALNIAERRVQNVSVSKDGRITAIDLMLSVTGDFKIEAVFDKIYYNVTVDGGEEGNCTLDRTTVGYNGSAVILATPKTGYNIVGYTVNGVQTDVIPAKEGASISIRFNGTITEDKDIVILYEKITYTVSFVNNTTNISANVNGNALQNVYGFSLEYRKSASFTVTAQTGYAIERITINSVEQTVHYNAESYTYYVYGIKESVSVEIWFKVKSTDSVGANTYSIVYSEGDLADATFSAQHMHCEADLSNLIKVLAKDGYYLREVRLSGWKDGSAFAMTQPLVSQTQFQYTIPANSFDAGTEVAVRILTGTISYLLSIASEGAGSIEGRSAIENIYAKETVTLTVKADGNSYISKFYVDGDEISFTAEGWSQTVYNTTIKQYTYGLYSFVMNENTEVRVVFSTITYRVSLDPTSLGGTTTLTVDGQMGVTEITHGGYLHIGMQAAVGYHIKEIYINSSDKPVADFILPSGVANNNATASYNYKGEYIGGVYIGATSHITVKVVYEINRYSFQFDIINASNNFGGIDLNPGTLTSAYTLNGNVYSGIEHGRNFSITITPDSVNGYYLSSIRIVYKALGSSEKSEILLSFTDENGIITKSGGLYWFNRLIGSDDAGITADVEKITVTFDRNDFLFELYNESGTDKGNASVAFTHPTNSQAYVAIFHYATANVKTVYYYKDGAVYTLGGDGYNLTDISLRYNSLSGKYEFRSDGGTVYAFRIEFGIIYTVTAAPETGHVRTALYVNNADVNSQVSSNSYYIRISRDTVVKAVFEILTYNITFQITVADKSLTGKIPNSQILDYASIEIYNLVTGIRIALPASSDIISLTLPYGSRLQFIMTPQFGTKGYYVYNFYLNEQETALTGDMKNTVIYGGAVQGDGHFVAQDLAARVSFRITQYAVTTSLTYTENILGESANTVLEESGGSIAWGDTANIKVASGSGYMLQSITVKRGDGTETSVVLNPTTEELVYLTEQMYYDRRNTATNEIRDVLMILNVQTDVKVTATYARREYVLRYDFEGAANLESVATALNLRNDTYPTNTSAAGAWSGNVLTVPIKHYDEISAVITPKNGYAIVESEVILRAVYYNVVTGNYEPVLDNQGHEIIYTLELSGTKDIKSFTFHRESSVTADVVTQSSWEISLTVSIKRYTVSTNVTRISTNAAANTTAITMAVKDQNGSDLVVAGGLYQEAQSLTTASKGSVYTAEHHGYIRYDFTVADGFMLSELKMNGRSFTDFRTTALANTYFEYSAVREGSTIKYILRIFVIDAMITGADGFIKGQYDIDITLIVAPITYDIHVIINDTEYQNTVSAGQNIFTDGKTVTVYAGSQALHFDEFFANAVLYEGYRTVSLESKMLVGGVMTNTATQISSEGRLSIRTAQLGVSNVLTNTLSIYLIYTTVIKSYQNDIYGYAHSFELFPSGTEGRILNQSAAGTLTTSALSGGVRVEFTEGRSFDFFTLITAVAVAKEGYRMYGIEELVGGEWETVANGRRGVNLVVETLPGGVEQYTMNYMVDDYGNREFRVIYRQMTTVTVYVRNPYRSVTTSGIGVGNMTYSYCPGVIATINGSVQDSVLNNGSYMVTDTYQYIVYLGSTVRLTFRDYTQPNNVATTGEFSLYELSGTAFIKVPAIAEAGGLTILKKTELYLIDSNALRITYRKETNGADKTAVGGKVLFNTSVTELPNQSYAGSKALDEVTIRVTPYDGYIFTALKIRQIDVEASKLAGRVIYHTGDREWLPYTTNNAADTNEFSIVRTEVNGVIIFTVQMKANMELVFEFYKVYDLTFGLQFSDKNFSETGVSIYGATENAKIDYVSTGKVSYGTIFNLQSIGSTLTDKNYQFVGWYVNGNNVFTRLADRFPDLNLETRRFEVNENAMSLFQGGTSETNAITIIAMYQPIIDVVLINELFYYNEATGHWNSWYTGAGTSAQYYAYNPLSGVAFDKTIKNVSEAEPHTVSSVLSSTVFNTVKGFSSDLGWSLLNAVYENHPLSLENLLVYSTMYHYQMLYQNLDFSNFIGNTWTNNTIELKMNGLPSTVKFQSWQYYNWLTNSYEEITYKHNDPYNSRDAQGNILMIDNTSLEYNFALSYLFENTDMEYAIRDGGGTPMPLIIRPMLRKVVNVNLSKMSYAEELNKSPNYDFSRLINPEIIRDEISNSPYYNATSDDGMTGEYDYGASILIKYFSAYDENGDVLNYEDGVRHRFIGWFLDWAVSGEKGYRLISTDDSTAGYAMTLVYAFGAEPNDGILHLQATFIHQYYQTLYSYNVAGGEDYETALGRSPAAVQDAPAIKLAAMPQRGELMPTYNWVTGESGTQTVYYTREITSDLSDTHVIEFYVDVGCSYTFTLDMTRIARNNEKEIYEAAYMKGYDPDYDFLKDIRYDRSVLVVPQTAYSGETVLSSAVKQIDIRYQTIAQLIIKNLMYNAGITLPLALSKALTGDLNSGRITVWDVDSRAFVTDNTNMTPDGTVRISVPVTNIDYGGKFDYAPYGYMNGNGIEALKELIYYTDSAYNTICKRLFEPSSDAYRRRVEIDYNEKSGVGRKGEYIRDGSLLFGDKDFAGEKFSIDNTGNGTVNMPYRIFTVAQLKNLGYYYWYNDMSCYNVNSGGAVNFLLCADLNLQNVPTNASAVTNPAVTAGIDDAWVPICFADFGESTPRGFDGVFDGGGKTIRGIAVDGSRNLSEKNETDVLSGYDYASSKGGYGIFGAINGGTVKNLVLGNAYIDLINISSIGSADRVRNIGLLTATAYNATFSNIQFNDTANMTISSSTHGNVRVRIRATDANIGLLAGYMQNCNITMPASTDMVYLGNNARSIFFETRGSAGLIAGQVFGGTAAAPNVIRNIRISTSATSARFANGNESTVSENAINLGGLFGIVSGEIAVENTVITSNVVFKIGNDTAINVGGLIGKLADGAKLINTQFNFNINNHIEASNEGIIIDKSAASSDSYGKVGGYVGLNQGGYIINCYDSESARTYTANSLYTGETNWIVLTGANIGGIVGVNIGNDKGGGLVQGFNLYTSGSNPTRFKFVGRSTGNYGGIVGVNSNFGVIDDCSYTNTDATVNTNSYNNADNTQKGQLIYQYSKNRKTTSMSTSVGNMFARTVNGGTLNIGGIAGLNMGAAIFNSFIKYSRITADYENTVSNSDYGWRVSIGGIVGTHMVNTADSGATTKIGWAQQLMLSAEGRWLDRVQSCYTEGLSIALLGKIWCDDITVDLKERATSSDGTSLRVAAYAGVALAGIAGTTSGEINAGEFVINTCYSYYGYYVANFSAFGTTSVSTNTEAKEGFYEYNGTIIGPIGFNKKYNAVNAGILIDVQIRGITGGYGYDNAVANFVWELASIAAPLNSWITPQDSLLVDNDTKGATDRRGIAYSRSSLNPNMLALTHGGNQKHWGGGESGHTLVGIGGFVGLYDDPDGRIFRTNPTNGALLVCHVADRRADTGSYDVYDPINGRHKNYALIYANGTLNSIYVKYLVRGQESVSYTIV